MNEVGHTLTLLCDSQSHHEVTYIQYGSDRAMATAYHVIIVQKNRSISNADNVRYPTCVAHMQHTKKGQVH